MGPPISDAYAQALPRLTDQHHSLGALTLGVDVACDRKILPEDSSSTVKMPSCCVGGRVASLQLIAAHTDVNDVYTIVDEQVGVEFLWHQCAIRRTKLIHAAVAEVIRN